MVEMDKTVEMVDMVVMVTMEVNYYYSPFSFFQEFLSYPSL